VAGTTATAGTVAAVGGVSAATIAAVGVGTAAVVGGVVAVEASSDGGDGNSVSFTGRYILQWTDQTRITTFILDLIQTGASLTGSASETADECCIANCTAPITGTVNGTSAVLSNPGCRGTCECSTASTPYENEAVVTGGTWHGTLIDDGRILRISEAPDGRRDLLRQ